MRRKRETELYIRLSEKVSERYGISSLLQNKSIWWNTVVTDRFSDVYFMGSHYGVIGASALKLSDSSLNGIRFIFPILYSMRKANFKIVYNILGLIVQRDP